jgi:hypothetical protein
MGLVLILVKKNKRGRGKAIFQDLDPIRLLLEYPIVMP